MLLDQNGREVECVDVEIDAVVAASGKALAVILSESGRKVWIPISCIDVEACEIIEIGDSGTMKVAKWLADREGLVNDDQ